MTGFFSKIETRSVTRPDGRHLSCTACGLFRTAHTPKMKPFGDFEKQIMCIGAVPEEIEDIRGKQWQGKSGQLLKKTLAELGIDLFKDCINLNAVNCRPKTEEGETKIPKPFEVECCRRIVMSYIKQYKPKVIILFGNLAVQSVIGDRWKKDLGQISKWTGFTIPDQELQTWLCPVFHPIYLVKDDKPELMSVWKRDLKKAVELSNNSLFPVYKKPNIIYLEKTELDVFDKIKSGAIAFDFETTGLKPHMTGHKIICASVATSQQDVYVFMMPNKRSLRQAFVRLLENENVKKIAHNMKYEHAWSLNILEANVKNWSFDTMLAAHILDNREGTTGLKFQTFVRFGIIDYASDVTPFLSASDEFGSNTINSIQTFVKSTESAMKLQEYCALDSVFTFRLYAIQKQEMEQLQLPF